MARTETTQLSLGFQVPEFSLLDAVSDTVLEWKDLKGEVATVVMFICNHCPYVIHLDEALVKIANDYASQGIKFVAISSNDVEKYPEDAPDKMKEKALALGYPFPYLYDETQSVAKAFQAVCTPEFFVFDLANKCTYHGQFDESRPNTEVPITGYDLRQHLDALVDKKPYSTAQKPSIGCSIKWKN